MIWQTRARVRLSERAIVFWLTDEAGADGDHRFESRYEERLVRGANPFVADIKAPPC